MFALSARKVAIVAAIGLGSALSIGALAAQAASTPTSDDQIRPTTVSSTDDGRVDLRGDGTPEDNGVDDGLRGDGTPEDNGVDDGLRGDGTLDDDGIATAPAPGTPGGLPTDADHPQGDDSIGRADDRSGSSDDSSDDRSGRADDSGHDDSDDSDHGGDHDDDDNSNDDNSDDDNSGDGGGDDD